MFIKKAGGALTPHQERETTIASVGPGGKLDPEPLRGGRAGSTSSTAREEDQGDSLPIV